METSSSTVSCPVCKLSVLPVFYFCPNCGKLLRPKPLVVPLPRQMLLYFVSFFLPPVALPYAFRYMRQPNKATKIIGMVLFVIAIGSILLSFYSYYWFIQQFYSQYPQFDPSQLILN